MTQPINWEFIRQHYDDMIRYTTALRFGTAEPESILRRFTHNHFGVHQHADASGYFV